MRRSPRPASSEPAYHRAVVLRRCTCAAARKPCRARPLPARVAYLDRCPYDFARPAGMPEIREQHPTIDGVLEAWEERLGGDALAYRNHVYRVFNLSLALVPESAEREDLIAVAAVFHDLGIWSHSTFDYLRPSMRLAAAHLGDDERRNWVRPVELMIVMHHKLLPYRGEAEALVEGFRRADLCDLTAGRLRSRVDRDFLRELEARFPDQGFRRRVVRMAFGWARAHPSKPLPMFRL